MVRGAEQSWGEEGLEAMVLSRHRLSHPRREYAFPAVIAPSGEGRERPVAGRGPRILMVR